MTASNTARQIVCWNQGEYIQFQYAVAELHKKLRRATERENPDRSDAQTYRNALRKFIDENIVRIAHNNFALLQDYYRGRRDIAPRICIKAIRDSRKGPTIVPLIRDARVPYFSEYPLDAHSAFLLIRTYGDYCLVDDVPNQTVLGNYRNARLCKKKLEAHLLSLENRATALTDQEWRGDAGWLDCWTAHTEADGEPLRVTDPKCCYKSVLVIPITLWNNGLANDFREEINKKHRIDTAVADIGRFIFGYVCFDHVDRNYFRRPEDIDIGYIVADLMSFYMVTRMLYLETSTTYRNACILLGDESSV